jgi:hypothetical protein
MNDLQLLAFLSCGVMALAFCLLVRAAARGGPDWTWGMPGNPFRYGRRATMVRGVLGVMWAIALAVASFFLFAR